MKSETKTSNQNPNQIPSTVRSYRLTGRARKGAKATKESQANQNPENLKALNALWKRKELAARGCCCCWWWRCCLLLLLVLVLLLGLWSEKVNREHWQHAKCKCLLSLSRKCWLNPKPNVNKLTSPAHCEQWLVGGEVTRDSAGERCGELNLQEQTRCRPVHPVAVRQPVS